MVVFTPSTLGGLGAAAVTAWALQRRRFGTDRRMVLVDAGSGSTRCVCLGTRRGDGAVRVIGGPERVPRRLGDALLADDVDAWAADVARAVDAIAPTRSTPVRGAGTAGAREALRKKGEKATGKAGRSVEAALAEHTQGRPTAFAVLTGAEEARLELRAVSNALPGAGVLAGGGKSVQVASSADDAASLDLDSFAGHALVRKHGAKAGAMMHEWASRKDLANALQGNVRSYEGRFALVELAAGALNLAHGPPDADVSVAEFASLLEVRREALEASLNPTENSADRKRVNNENNAPAVRELIYAVQLGCVLDLVFKKDATFRALPNQAVGSEPAVNWALGLYLDRRDS